MKYHYQVAACMFIIGAVLMYFAFDVATHYATIPDPEGAYGVTTAMILGIIALIWLGLAWCVMDEKMQYDKKRNHYTEPKRFRRKKDEILNQSKPKWRV